IPKVMASQIEALRSGTKPPAAVLSQLLTHTRSPDDETSAAAKQLVAKMTAGGQQVLEQAEALAATDPVGAYLKAERLPLIFKGTPVATAATKSLGKLRRDKAVMTELRARPALTMVRTFDTELGSRPGSFDPKLKEFRQENAEMIAQLRDTIILMKKSWPASQATAEALRTSEKYGLILP
ncbi:MAG TPA: hypothetical protein VHY20_00995, partial [Pirellulales bacterium]|nr:hypothetical protein [Pirellulales bacterium]